MNQWTQETSGYPKGHYYLRRGLNVGRSNPLNSRNEDSILDF